MSAQRQELPPVPVATGRKRKFDIEITVTVTVEIDEAVLAECGHESWTEYIGVPGNPMSVAQHLVFNHIVNQVGDDQVPMLDGFARCKGMVTFEIDRDSIDMDGMETTPCQFTVSRGGHVFRCTRPFHDDTERHVIRTKKGEHRFVERKR